MEIINNSNKERKEKWKSGSKQWDLHAIMKLLHTQLCKSSTHCIVVRKNFWPLREENLVVKRIFLEKGWIESLRITELFNILSRILVFAAALNIVELKWKSNWFKKRTFRWKNQLQSLCMCVCLCVCVCVDRLFWQLANERACWNLKQWRHEFIFLPKNLRKTYWTSYRESHHLIFKI